LPVGVDGLDQPVKRPTRVNQLHSRGGLAGVHCTHVDERVGADFLARLREGIDCSDAHCGQVLP
jgi:hypothetical protein